MMRAFLPHGHMASGRRAYLMFAALLMAFFCLAVGASDRANAQAATSYRMGPDDKLRIIVYGEQQISGEYVIGGDGNVALPLIGTAKAAGLTAADFQTQLTATYGQSFLVNPRISVDIIEYRPFYILGEVNKAGQYPYRVGMTVMRAVATAEGFTYRAQKKKVAIQGPDGVERVVALTPQTLVNPGDTIRVLERYF